MLHFNDQGLNQADEVLSLGARMGTGCFYADPKELTGRTVSIGGREVINFTSCSSLGLEHHEKIKQGMIEAIQKYGATFSTSRIFCSSPQFQELEGLMREIFAAHPVITTTTTLGHFSALPVLIQEGDVIILDQQVHRSVQMAAQVMAHKARIATIRHNDLEQLEKSISAHKAAGAGNIWYCADGVYSMFGDLAPLPELHALLQRHEDLYMYIDDAHGMSWQGEHGRGVVLGSDFVHEKMVVAVSLCKSFGIGGGGVVVFQNSAWQRKVDICGPMRIFANPLTVPLVGGAVASARIHLSPEITLLQRNIERRIAHFRACARAKGLPMIHDSTTPIQYVLLGGLKPEPTFHVINAVMEEGFYVNPATFPAVPRNKAGCRLTLCNHVTMEDIAALVDCLAYYSRKFVDEEAGSG